MVVNILFFIFTLKKSLFGTMDWTQHLCFELESHYIVWAVLKRAMCPGLASDSHAPACASPVLGAAGTQHRAQLRRQDEGQVIVFNLVLVKPWLQAISINLWKNYDRSRFLVHWEQINPRHKNLDMTADPEKHLFLLGTSTRELRTVLKEYCTVVMWHHMRWNQINYSKLEYVFLFK